MQLKEVEVILNKFAKYVIQQARTNLTKGVDGKSKNTSKKLYNSLEHKVNRYKDSIDVLFLMEEYGFFQDLGVSGKKVKYDTPYSYKDKMPPPSSLDKWIVRKGLAPRKNGKFKNRTIDKVGFRKSIQFLVARSIFMKGIKPSMFFTKPFQKAFKYLPNELKDAFIFDIEQDKMFFPQNMNKN